LLKLLIISGKESFKTGAFPLKNDLISIISLKSPTPGLALSQVKTKDFTLSILFRSDFTLKMNINSLCGHIFAAMSSNQRTIQRPVSFSGVGLHTGAVVNLTIQPAPEDHGYKFQRIDLDGHPVVNADCDLVVATQRGTTLEQNGVRVYTTEHVLSALYGCRVDNA
jgi:hypothetical protein